MRSHVFHILAQKGRTVITVRAGDTVLDVTTTLARHNIGGAPVVGPDEQLVGLISEKMIVHALSQRGPDLALLTARNIMTRDMPTATPDDSIHDIACRMTYSRSRHIPVLEKGKLAELISEGDIVKLRAENTEQEAQELHEYIIGSGHTAVQFSAGMSPIQYGEKKS